MSVLIKGLIMPSCCDGCTFSDWSNLHQTASCKLHDYDPCFADYSREYTDKRADFCPLVKIPAHGRLIDADKLLRDAPRYVGCPPRYEPRFLARLDVENAPSVIEAEGNDE